MAILKTRTPAQKAAYVVLALAIVTAVGWLVLYTPIGHLLSWD